MVGAVELHVIMDSHTWSGAESELAFNKVRYVIDLLNQNFGGDSSVHVGIIYLAVGNNGGRSTTRYLLFLPYYNPSLHGYNFNIQHPFVFARGFPGTASLDFYSWLDSEWTKAIDELSDSRDLMECSPIMICKFANTETAEFQSLSWKESERGAGAMFVKIDGVECWIHGPMASASMEKRIVRNLKSDHSAEFMRLLNAGETKALQEMLKLLVESSNSFSFPTIQMQIDSPMAGLVPFDVKPVRLKIGGEIAAEDRAANTVHIPVTKPGYATRRISFQRLWDVLYDEKALYGNLGSVRGVRENIRRALEC